MPLPSEEGVEHASLEAPALREVPPAATHHLAQVGAADQAGREEAAAAPSLPVEAPERGGASLEDLHADGAVARHPLAHAHGSDGGGDATGPGWRHAVEDGLAVPQRRRPAPHCAGLLGQGHPAQVAERQQTRLLQGLLVGEAQQHRHQAWNSTAAQQQLLQLG